ncbi:hypothetical protein A3F03_01505 [Candidatus Roizmanbacteria bacterium RIFCSPHIGHO2_12_FULL_41_11]|uniref:Membrane insertase YidC/Oxa/ALB C-terminal domain-containing protein n=3 Tax=Candidatus Roizmaniibacteriota TaxID=1752723 RepID=A0A1F7JRR6_9BACT|nr:MAG: hypothetical protein A3F03_01505 [Candidatus Roizmanbacteria bacterium RIFCSPHIGHO2_12_FULL_41_11]OGK52294.1 MAG: hypothetical protein A2966_03300 [Candidatus Roizmanbacteria bacterium RIFCSPLOWO2_01_FULL_41_22]OGK58329.1 MAG: hypothetical protein A3H86_03895 [Candidatus Roizmanbacteria bacterium RIFCSPLOWO2_02_FULL_41_9]
MLGTLFNTAIIQPILNILVAFYKLFLVVHLPGAFGFAIIALTVCVRLLMHPFFKQQIHTSKKMQDLKPHLDRLSDKHKKDPKKLQQEQMRLYKEAGINPASGCLFAIVQIPLFLGLYQTLQRFLLNGTTTKVITGINKELYAAFLKISSIDPWFFGFNLALSPAKAHVWYYLSVPIITAVLQFFQAQTTLLPTSKPDEKKKLSLEKDSKNKDKKESSTGEDFQKAMNTQMKYFFPLMIGYFSYTLPIGLSLYWNIFSIFSIIQHATMKKPDGQSAVKK